MTAPSPPAGAGASPGPDLTEKVWCAWCGEWHLVWCAQRVALREEVARLTAELERLDREAREAREMKWALQRAGWRPCDVAACNCGEWHAGPDSGEAKLIEVVLDNDRMRAELEREPQRVLQEAAELAELFMFQTESTHRVADWTSYAAAASDIAVALIRLARPHPGGAPEADPWLLGL